MSYYSEERDYFEEDKEDYYQDHDVVSTTFESKVWIDKDKKRHFFFEMDLSYLMSVKKFLEERNQILPYELLREIYNKEKE